jgi:hypothetical protein
MEGKKMIDLYSFIICENFHDNIVNVCNLIKSKIPDISKKELNRVADLMSRTKLQNNKDFMIKMASRYIKSKDRSNMDFEEVFKYIKNRPILKNFFVTTANHERIELKRKMLSIKIENFAYYGPLDKDSLYISNLSDWNEMYRRFTSEEHDLSDKGLKLYASHGDYDMYEINDEDDLEVPLVKNMMPWCILREGGDTFGGYGGPPYYPIMKRSNKHPVGIVVPKNFRNGYIGDTIANDKNNGPMRMELVKELKPLLKLVFSKEKSDMYSATIHDLKFSLPKNPTPEEAIRIFSGGFSGDWPEGEEAISKDTDIAFEYAMTLPKGQRFEKGEDSIAADALYSRAYAEHLGPRKRFEKGELEISKDPIESLRHAIHLKSRFLLGEDVMYKDKHSWSEYLKLLKELKIEAPVIKVEREEEEDTDRFAFYATDDYEKGSDIESIQRKISKGKMTEEEAIQLVMARSGMNEYGASLYIKEGGGEYVLIHDSIDKAIEHAEGGMAVARYVLKIDLDEVTVEKDRFGNLMVLDRIQARAISVMNEKE